MRGLWRDPSWQRTVEVEVSRTYPVTVALTRDLLVAVDAVARRDALTRSEIVRRALGAHPLVRDALDGVMENCLHDGDRTTLASGDEMCLLCHGRSSDGGASWRDRVG
jgi:hypothetical protein